MTTQIRLNRYERGIVHSLEEDFGYSAEVARHIVVQFIGVVRKLGGYDNCFDHAERLHLAYKEGHPPEQWLERIRNIERDSMTDKGIIHLENPYVHVR